MMWVRILDAVGAAIWGLLIWAGVDGMRGVVDQHASGYPNNGQIEFYVGVPALMVLICSAALGLTVAIRHPWVKTASLLFGWLALAVLLPYLYFYGGGA